LTYFTILTAYIRRLLLARPNNFIALSICLTIVFFHTLSAEAIPFDDRRFEFSPRPWTLPGKLTPEEHAQHAIDVLKPITDTTTTPPTIIVTQPQPMEIPVPTPETIALTPNITTLTTTAASNLMTVKALANAGPPPVQVAYQEKYKELQTRWKTQVSGKPISAGYKVFFEQDSSLSYLNSDSSSSSVDYSNPILDEAPHESVQALSSGNLTSNALQSLMLRYLSDNPNIDILVDGVNVASAFVEETTNTIRIDDALINSVLLTPSRDAFAKKNRSVYSSIVRLEGSGRGQYINVVIDKQGHVSVIDTALKEKRYASNLLSQIVRSLNKQRLATDLKFVTANTDPIVYTGLQGSDDDNTRSALYAFAYWSAFMKDDKLDSYTNVNGAASESTNYLNSYDSLNLCAVYSKKLKKTTGKHDSNAYELDLRGWLSNQVIF
jgi:hypothetical protein